MEKERSTLSPKPNKPPRDAKMRSVYLHARQGSTFCWIGNRAISTSHVCDRCNKYDYRPDKSAISFGIYCEMLELDVNKLFNSGCWLEIEDTLNEISASGWAMG